MQVVNIHERIMDAPYDQVGRLIDSLSSKEDKLWPKKKWPPMRLNNGLNIGSAGGHGPIRYSVEEYKPGASVRFRFTGPKGFNGCHFFEIQEHNSQQALLRHNIEMKTTGSALVTWPLIYRPMHDALIEDAFTAAQSSLGIKPEVKPWSTWVKFLRWLFAGRKTQKQYIPV